MYHAGYAGTDANTAFTSVADSLKYHVHFVKERYSLPDGIRYLQSLKPRYLQPPSNTQDDIEAVIDAVCGEFSAIEKAITEALVSSRGWDVTEFGSSAALPQHADHGTRTKRLACSLRKT